MSAQEAVFTGDTIWDVRVCRKPGFPCIGLLSGGISRDELSMAGAAQVGITVIIPGERITAEFLDYLRSGVNAGMQLPDAADSALDTIRVVSQDEPK